MSEQTDNERLSKILFDHHDQLSRFARESYASDGRGVIYVKYPDVPPGVTVSGTTQMKYITLAEIRELAGDDVLVRMLETYDPTRQAVVTAAIEGHNPISIKMRLERPTLVHDVGGVH